MYKMYGENKNKKKTKVMRIMQEEEGLRIQIEEEAIEQVQQFTYLGVKIDNNGKQEPDIEDRIDKAGKLYHALNWKFLKKKEISTKTKMTVYKTIFRPVLTYGCESWSTTGKIKSNIQTMEIKFLRGMKGITRMD